MKPGRELDALVAAKVMGLKIKWIGGDTGHPRDIRDPWTSAGDGSPGSGVKHPVDNYSTDIAAAWGVFEFMKTRGFDCVVSFRTREQKHQAWFVPNGDYYAGGDTDAYSDSAPHAICLAALKAVGIEA